MEQGGESKKRWTEKRKGLMEKEQRGESGWRKKGESKKRWTEKGKGLDRKRKSGEGGWKQEKGKVRRGRQRKEKGCWERKRVGKMN